MNSTMIIIVTLTTFLIFFTSFAFSIWLKKGIENAPDIIDPRCEFYCNNAYLIQILKRIRDEKLINVESTIYKDIKNVLKCKPRNCDIYPSTKKAYKIYKKERKKFKDKISFCNWLLKTSKKNIV